MSNLTDGPSFAEGEQDPEVLGLRDALRVAVPVEDPEVVQKRRDRLVRAIDIEIRKAPQRQLAAEREQRLASVLRYGSAAALLVATLGLGMLLSSGQSDVETSNAKSTSAGVVEASPGSGSILVATPTRERLFELPGQTRVSLQARSQVALLNDSIQSQVMRLERGGIQIAVPPPDGRTHRSVSVLTPHAKVLVKGTQFSVELLDEGEEGRTQVAVTRGVVEVEHLTGHVTLRAGQSWVSESTAVFESSSAVSSPSTQTSSGRSKETTDDSQGVLGSTRVQQAELNSPVRSSTSTPKVSPEQASTLAAQNELLEAALVAADQGDHQQALRLTSRLLSQYPSSPLRASARAVRKRVKAAAETRSVQ